MSLLLLFNSTSVAKPFIRLARLFGSKTRITLSGSSSRITLSGSVE